MLSVIGADWEPIYVDFFKAGVQRTPEYRDKINEMGEAPVLRHGDIKLSQSGVILLYLAQRSGKFLPRGEDAQLEALRWIIFDNQQVGGALGPYRFLRNRADSALAIFDKRLSRGPYILGAEPTIADISLTSYLYYPSQEFGLKAADAVKRMVGASPRCEVYLKSSTVANGSADHGLKRFNMNFVFCLGWTSTRR